MELRERLLEHARQRAASLPGLGSVELSRRRAEALELFASRGLPAQREEDWRFTPLRALESLPLEPAQRAAQPCAPRAAALRGGCCLAFADGFAEAAAAPAGLPAGVHVEPLAQLLARDPERVCARLGALADPKLRSFTALSTALFEDGAWIELDAGCALEQPLELLFWQSAGAVPRAVHPRCVIALGAGSRATVVEHHLGGGAAGGLVNAVTEIALGRDARLDHVVLQHAGASSVHLGQIVVQQERGSQLGSHSIALGAALSRVEIETHLAGEQAHALLHGLYLGRGDQLVDHHTAIEHIAPHTTSSELYKGILDQRARGVFHGSIRVRPDAQRIDARQSSRALLLADGPTIHAKPQLEIYADDVRCSHGATVGRLDEQALFYLRSRGIGEPEARALLTLAFAREVSDALPLPELRERLERAVPLWLLGRDGASAADALAGAAQ